MKRFIAIVLLIGLLGSSLGYAQQGIIKPFSAKSYAEILKNNEGKEFTLIFWSIMCSPCIKELALISKNKIYVNHTLIFVSTDYEYPVADITAVIKQFNLQDQEHWVFNGSDVLAIISSVDKSWYGEVPRNYFFDDEHNRIRLQQIQ